MSNEYKDIFIEEAREQVDILNDRLLSIEKNPNNMPMIHDIFRVAHTLKSSAAFVGLNELSDFCHKIENLLQKVRDKEITLSSDLTDFLFKSLDKIRESVEAFAESDEIIKDFQNLLNKLNSFNILKINDKQEENIIVSLESDNVKYLKLDEQQWNESKKLILEGNSIFYIAVFFEDDVKMKWVRAELIFVNVERLAKVISCHPSLDQFKTDKLQDRIELIISSPDADQNMLEKQLYLDLIRKVSVIKLDENGLNGFYDQPSVQQEIVNQPDEKILSNKNLPENEEKTVHSQEYTGVERRKENLNKESESLDSEFITETIDNKNILSKSDTVRVPIKKLDELLNLVGELAIVNSSFVEISDRFHEKMGNQEIVSDLGTKIDLLSNIARNLQEGIMQSRMVPIGSVFSRFTRLVRDLSKNLDKNVNIVFKGEETELDKKIIDVVGDPLIHLIRNSIDHGLESMDVRKSLGKKDVGTILLNAYQSGNYIFVEVTDDGQGLNKDKILNKAIEKSLITAEDAKQYSETEVFNLIFLPGFSTKQEVTAISGRGVGMDVVIDTVKKLNGAVSVRSKEGEGSTFTLSFPLTLAIVPAILIQCGDEIYAIPLSSVQETIKIFSNEIQSVDFQEVIQLREKVIPLIRLNDAFNINSENGNKRLSIVISDYEDQQIGIVVDKLLGKREIVIKSLSQDFQSLHGISGATILGNGQIALILDIPGLIRQNKEHGFSRRKMKYSEKNIISKESEQNKIIEYQIKQRKETRAKILKDFNIDDRLYKLINEIFKLALSNSSNNIKRFLNKSVILAVPDIDVHMFKTVRELTKFVGDEKMFYGEIDLTESLHGKVIISLDEKGMRLLFNELLGNQPVESEVGKSCIMEITNLLAAGITNTFSRALGILSYPSPPKFIHSSYAKYFQTLFEQHQKANNQYIWVIDTDIIVDKQVIKGKVYVFPYDSSFHLIGKSVSSKEKELSYIINE